MGRRGPAVDLLRPGLIAVSDEDRLLTSRLDRRDLGNVGALHEADRRVAARRGEQERGSRYCRNDADVLRASPYGADHETDLIRRRGRGSTAAVDAPWISCGDLGRPSAARALCTPSGSRALEASRHPQELRGLPRNRSLGATFLLKGATRREYRLGSARRSRQQQPERGAGPRCDDHC